MDAFDGSIETHEFRRLKNFIVFPEIDSTNEVGRGLIDHAAQEEVDLLPSVIVAETQLRGRGRHDRVWVSPCGGLYATFAWKVPEETRISLLPLAAALWAAEACGRALEIEPELKWPNDLICRGKKLGGILAEAKTRGEETHAAIGFGINVFLPAAAVPGATAAQLESTRPPSLSKLFLELCRSFEQYLAAPAIDGAVGAWEARSAHRAGDLLGVAVETPGGAKTIQGGYAGLTNDGFLRLHTGSGEEVLSAGEVRSW
jgi:BirA family biotin operon repressor/biotin-[acetyl-CoA-carboxylase] ligase